MIDYENYQDEIMQEIREEVGEYAENMQRSEEDGWFYPDGDDE